MDIDGVKTKLLLWYYNRLDGSKWPFVDPPTLKGLKQICSIYPSLENVLKSEAEFTMRNLTSNHLGQRSGWLIKLKIENRAGSLGWTLHWGPFYTIMGKWSGNRKEKFPGLLTQASIRLK